MTNDYTTYVVRLRVTDQNRQLPKIVVENPHTGSKLSFGNWEDLVSFLQLKSIRLSGDTDDQNSNQARGSGA